MADSHAHKPDHAVAHHAPPPHSSGHDVDHAHVMAHLKKYVAVGGVLFIGTALTVWLSYIDLGEWNIGVAMLVATIKAGLVAAIFMHLENERATIWRFLLFTAIFATGMFALTYFHWWDPIMGSVRNVHH